MCFRCPPSGSIDYLVLIVAQVDLEYGNLLHISWCGAARDHRTKTLSRLRFLVYMDQFLTTCCTPVHLIAPVFARAVFYSAGDRSNKNTSAVISPPPTTNVHHYHHPLKAKMFAIAMPSDW
jgi:hypothetical protein